MRRDWRGPRAVAVGVLAAVAAIAGAEAAVDALSPLALAGTKAGTGAKVRYTNPLRLASRPLSCPDPGVSPDTGSYRYVLLCTSDLAANGIPIFLSNDLVHWRRHGFVFPRGHQPWWAMLSTGRVEGGRYWAPEIFRIHGRWVVYFAAQHDPAKAPLRYADGTSVPAVAMVLGVAFARSLHGPWHTWILHYRGGLDAVAPAQEGIGDTGAIDPSVLTDPRTGRRYLFWTNQPNEIWEGELSADGLSLSRHIHKVLTQSRPWECDPWFMADCLVEAPEPFYHDGRLYLLYSGASTWDASYAVGAAVSRRGPAGPFIKLGRVLRSGRGFSGPGHTSQPITGPNGGTYVLYHAHRMPSYDRLLMLDPLNWRRGVPQVSDGRPGWGGWL